MAHVSRQAAATNTLSAFCASAGTDGVDLTAAAARASPSSSPPAADSIIGGADGTSLAEADVFSAIAGLLGVEPSRVLVPVERASTNCGQRGEV